MDRINCCICLLLASTAFQLVHTSIFQQITCPMEALAPNCSCNAYNFSCPDFNVQLKFGGQVDLKCNTENPDLFKNKLNLAIGPLRLLAIEDCTMDEERPMLETIKFLGIMNVTQLYYHSDKNSVHYDASFLEGFEQLEQIDMSGNEESGLASNETLTELPEKLFANLLELKQISLLHNGIRHLPKSLFKGLSKVDNLILSFNNIAKLPEGLLSDLKRLQILYLNHNQLEEIEQHYFNINEELQELDLSNNLLRSIPDYCFSTLVQMKTLHLENNQIHTINSIAFSAMAYLEELYMQNNQLAWHANSFKPVINGWIIGITGFFWNLVNLRVLQLSNNSMTTFVKQWLPNDTQLNDLNLSYNKIKQLSYSDLQIGGNVFLNLSNNMISKITVGDLNQTPNVGQTIKAVVLDNNPLNCDCDALKFVQLVQSNQTNAFQLFTTNLRCAEPPNLHGRLTNQVQTKDLVCYFQLNCPIDCHCVKRPLDHTIVVNCSDRGLTHIPELPIPSKVDTNYRATELRVENNLISELPLLNLTGYSEVTELYARNNSIQKLLPQNIPTRIHRMDLSQNHLQLIDNSTLETLNHSAHLGILQLSQNPWLCDCSATNFLIFVQKNRPLISDISEMRCHSSGKSHDSISVSELCYVDYTKVIVLVVPGVLFASISLLSLLIFRYRTEVKVWLFSHNLLPSLISEEELDKDKDYDAFISYAHLDEDFVTDELIPKLENEPMNFKICWHIRDFTPGEMIITQIVKSIEASRRTLIVLSKNFLESNWAKHEFRQAHTQSMAENRVRVIVIIYEDIGDIESLDGELKAYLRTNTYVKWGDPWFWQKLRYAMPHPPKLKAVRSAESETNLLQETATETMAM